MRRHQSVGDICVSAAICCMMASLVAADYVHPLNFVNTISRRSLIQDATITANISEYDGSSLVPVLVTWSGVKNPDKSDMLALYAPQAKTIQMNEHMPVQVQSCLQASPDYLTTGNGSWVFYLVNLRANVAFVLFQNCSGCADPITLNGIEAVNDDYGPYVESMDVVAQSVIIPNTAPAKPSSGLLTIAALSDKMTVTWTSASNTTMFVQWGIHPSIEKMVRRTRGIPDTYTKDQMCGSISQGVGFLPPGYIHTAILDIKGLKPDMKIYYRYGSDLVGWSEIESFLVPPPPGDFSTPLRFLGIVDVGVFNPGQVVWVDPYGNGSSLSYTQHTSNASKLVPWLLKEKAHLLLVPGDVTYAQGFAADWDVFGAQFQGAFRKFPVAVGMGNHERDILNNTVPCCNSASSNGECGIPTLYRYPTPATPALKAALKADGNQGYKLGPLVYSFSRGPVHFIMLDTEMNSTIGSPQYDFVALDLKRVDRTMTPWIIVSMHRPMYLPTTYWKDINNAARLVSDWEGLFMDHNVDIVFSGHEHSYARSCPLFNSTCCDKNKTCPVYIMAGTAGSGFTNDYPSVIPSIYLAATQFANSYVRWMATSRTLKMELVSTDSGKMLDFLLLTKPPV